MGMPLLKGGSRSYFCLTNELIQHASWPDVTFRCSMLSCLWVKRKCESLMLAEGGFLWGLCIVGQGRMISLYLGKTGFHFSSYGLEWISNSMSSFFLFSSFTVASWVEGWSTHTSLNIEVWPEHWLTVEFFLCLSSCSTLSCRISLPSTDHSYLLHMVELLFGKQSGTFCLLDMQPSSHFIFYCLFSKFYLSYQR